MVRNNSVQKQPTKALGPGVVVHACNPSQYSKGRGRRITSSRIA
jgi:hypothetical protein